VSTFVLVHGAYLGGWCWELLMPELRKFGHDAFAFDLPIEESEAGAERYAQAALAALNGKSKLKNLILVGHSMGGLVIPLLCEKVETAQLIFLAAALPKPNSSFMERAKTSEQDVFLTTGEVNPFKNRQLAFDYWFHDCGADVAKWASERLRDMRSAKVIFETSPIEKLPAIKMASIVGTDERLLSPVWSRRMTRELLNVEPIEIAAGHCPQVSRPAELAAILDKLAGS
jgi:pimeloyl-ACP methyl ester carboxylesterase